MTITIIGAGMAGLLAANMLKHKNPTILEKQASLPNNHSAVLRFRSPIVGDVTGIPFRKVNVLKATIPWLNPIADALAYANKNTGTYLSNRSIPTSVESIERYIAPMNFIEQLAAPLTVHYGCEIDDVEHDLYDVKDSPIISTIPMPVLMDLLNYQGERPEFKHIQGSNVTARIEDCDAYVSIYLPAPNSPFSRISITGDELIAECPSGTDRRRDILPYVEIYLGINKKRVHDVDGKHQQYAKIQECDEGLRRRFIAWASDEHNIYSLGRYACWRPGLLLDDLVQDIRRIEYWINHGHYERRRTR